MKKAAFALSAAGAENRAAILVCCVLVGLASHGPILQPQAYHAFADTRGLGTSIPNLIDVLSNLAFLMAGLVGLWLCPRAPHPQQGSLNLFSVGLVLTALGSAYYHWAPGDQTLLWDRLPMTITFAGALGAMAAQYLGPHAAMRWQNAWLYLGVISVALWAVGGDLRLYVVAQVGGFLIGLLWIVARPAHAKALALPWAWVWVGYTLAKLAESGDTTIWNLTGGVLAGHGLKHVFAALGTVPLWLTLYRLPKPTSSAR